MSGANVAPGKFIISITYVCNYIILYAYVLTCITLYYIINNIRGQCYEGS